MIIYSFTKKPAINKFLKLLVPIWQIQVIAMQ